ncbi:MAG: helix-turn-helix domain-containing protein [Flavonifractor plautii]
MNEIFAFRLRKLRERRRVSRRTLADLCGVSKSAMARYERGSGNPAPRWCVNWRTTSEYRRTTCWAVRKIFRLSPIGDSLRPGHGSMKL